MIQTLEQKLDELAEKEVWINDVALLIERAFPWIDPRCALDGCRWASMWLDALSELIIELGGCVPDGEMKSLIDEAYELSLDRCEGLACYPNGAPALYVAQAAMEAFCFAFEEESEAMRQLLEAEPA